MQILLADVEKGVDVKSEDHHSDLDTLSRNHDISLVTFQNLKCQPHDGAKLKVKSEDH